MGPPWNLGWSDQAFATAQELLSSQRTEHSPPVLSSGRLLLVDKDCSQIRRLPQPTTGAPVYLVCILTFPLLGAGMICQLLLGLLPRSHACGAALDIVLQRLGRSEWIHRKLWVGHVMLARLAHVSCGRRSCTDVDSYWGWDGGGYPIEEHGSSIHCSQARWRMYTLGLFPPVSVIPGWGMGRETAPASFFVLGKVFQRSLSLQHRLWISKQISLPYIPGIFLLFFYFFNFFSSQAFFKLLF